MGRRASPGSLQTGSGGLFSYVKQGLAETGTSSTRVRCVVAVGKEGRASCWGSRQGEPAYLHQPQGLQPLHDDRQ